ncbi:hypothetical protein M514_20739 [Trichuris suis]|uniref:Protein-tyrosine phosphatase n=1 Tax=Trichuris suis TaxID=68888 RepID=A0A085NCC3_9BILA|nr:hypothetical protein M514_20739 [Trichuris suis]
MYTPPTVPLKQTARQERQTRASWLGDLCNIKYEQLIFRLREEFSALPGRPDVSEAKAFLTQLNKDKNRYIDIPCLDRTRVKLQQRKADYIHANWVECPELNIKVIMCQAPLDDTVEDFYHMLYQEKVGLIACLTKVTESGVEKSYPYWPVAEGKQTTFGKYSLKARSSSHEESYCHVTALELTKQDSKQSQKITHILYMDWTDHKAPNCTHRFLEVVNLCTRKFSGLKTNGTPPTIVIHCSAGIGRSGTLAALLRLQKTIENGKAPNIPSVVQQLRQQRALAVQSIEQYIFIYRTIMEMIYKLEGRPKQSSGELLKHINALRSMTTRSTCNLQLELMKHPKGGYTFFPVGIADAKRLTNLAQQQFGIIKQQTVAKAVKLKTGIIDLKKRLSARLLAKTPKTRSPADIAAKGKANAKGAPIREIPLVRQSLTVEPTVPKLSTPTDNFEQRIIVPTEQKKQSASPSPGKKIDIQKNKPTTPYVGKAQNAWHTCALLLEEMTAYCGPSPMQAVAPFSRVEQLEVLDAFSNLLSALGESDLSTAVWMRKSSDEALRQGMLWDQHGQYEKSRDHYFNTIKLREQSEAWNSQEPGRWVFDHHEMVEHFYWLAILSNLTTTFSFYLFQPFYSACEQLGKWKDVHDLSMRPPEDPMHALESSWRIDNLENVQSCFETIENNCPKEWLLKLALYRGYLSFRTSEQQDGAAIHRNVQSCISLLIKEGRCLPSVFGPGHLKLLRLGQLVLELSEASEYHIQFLRLTSGHQPSTVDLKNLQRLWGNPLRNETSILCDDAIHVSSVLTWRIRYLSILESLTTPTDLRSTQRISDMKGKALLVAARAARKLKMLSFADDCLGNFRVLHYAIPKDVGTWIKECALMQVAKARSLRSVNEMAYPLLQATLMINEADHDFIPAENNAELFSVQGVMYSMLKQDKLAEELFTYSSQINPNYSKNWKNWGIHLESAFLKNRNDMSIGIEAIVRLLNTAISGSEWKVRKCMASVFYLLHFDDDKDTLKIQFLLKALQLEARHFVFWLPQLFDLLCVRKFFIVANLIGHVAKEFPESVLCHLQIYRSSAGNGMDEEVAAALEKVHKHIAITYPVLSSAFADFSKRDNQPCIEMVLFNRTFGSACAPQFSLGNFESADWLEDRVVVGSEITLCSTYILTSDPITPGPPFQPISALEIGQSELGGAIAPKRSQGALTILTLRNTEYYSEGVKELVAVKIPKVEIPIGQNPDSRNPERYKSRTGQNPERSKSRMAQNPDRSKSRMGRNPE